MELPANGYLTSFYSGNVDGKRLQDMLDYVAKYHVNAAPERVFSLEEVSKAHAYLDGAHSFGKVVVVQKMAATVQHKGVSPDKGNTVRSDSFPAYTAE